MRSTVREKPAVSHMVNNGFLYLVSPIESIMIALLLGATR